MAHAGAQAIRRIDAKVEPVEGDDDVGPVSAMAREHSVVRIDHVTTAAMAPPTPTTAIAHEASQSLRMAGAGGLALTEDAVQANARHDDDTARPGSQSSPNALRADTVDAASAPRAHATAPAKEEARADAPTSRSVAEQVAARLTPLRQGRQAVSLRLDPPELGSVRIEAVLDGHKLSVSITAERESSRSLLEGALGQLRDALTDRGLVTDQLTVHVGLDGSGGDLAHHQTPQPVLEDDSAISPVRAVTRPQAAALAPSASDGLDLWA
jgi:flagellar hook-length control protein FliK